MQEHTAKKLRISILLWLLILALAFPYLIHYYEQQQVFQWQEMVQPHWEKEIVPATPIMQDSAIVQGSAAADVAEWKSIETEPEPQPEKVVETNNAGKVISQKIPIQKKTGQKVVTAKKNNNLTLHLPDNLYHGQASEWEEKKPVTIPDFFAPKDEPSRYQLGGRLIIDEDKKKQVPDASYIDTVKGAEVHIQVMMP